MKLRNNKKALAVASLLLVAVITVAGVIAYFFQSTEVVNHLNTNRAEVILGEKFNPSEHWVPGETIDKQVLFGNTGETDMLLRFRVDVSLLDKNGDPAELPDHFYELVWNKDQEEGIDALWTRKTVQEGEESVNYYYYNQVFKASEQTPITLEAVKFSEKLSNDTEGLLTDYSGYTLKVDVKGEMIQVDEKAAEEAGWNPVKLTEKNGNIQVEWTEG